MSFKPTPAGLKGNLAGWSLSNPAFGGREGENQSEGYARRSSYLGTCGPGCETGASTKLIPNGPVRGFCCYSGIVLFFTDGAYDLVFVAIEATLFR